MKRLNIFYFNAHSGASIPATAPILSNLTAANRTLHTIRGDGSFLGIIVSDETTVQFSKEQNDRIWVEKLNTVQRKTRGCHVSAAIAEQALEAVFRGGDLEQVLVPYSVTWEDGTLP
jgi:hypothetical protein